MAVKRGVGISHQGVDIQESENQVTDQEIISDGDAPSSTSSSTRFQSAPVDQEDHSSTDTDIPLVADGDDSKGARRAVVKHVTWARSSPKSPVNDATAQHAAREAVPPKRKLDKESGSSAAKVARVAWPDPKMTINKIEPMIKYAQRLSKGGKKLPDALYAALQAWIDIEAVQTKTVGAERIVQAVLEIINGPTDEGQRSCAASSRGNDPGGLSSAPSPMDDTVASAPTPVDAGKLKEAENRQLNGTLLSSDEVILSHAVSRGVTDACAGNTGREASSSSRGAPIDASGGASQVSDDADDIADDQYDAGSGTEGSGTGQAIESDEESLDGDGLSDADSDQEEPDELFSDSDSEVDADELRSTIEKLNITDDVKSVLLVFAGSNVNAKRVATAIKEKNPAVSVTEVDWLNEKLDQNCLRPAVQNKILRELADGKYDRCLIATPCSSFSVAFYQDAEGNVDLSELRRSKDEPEGIQPIPEQWKRYVSMHNALANFSFTVFELCRSLNIGCIIENPALRSDDSSHAYWAEVANCGQLWDMPRAKALERNGAKRVLWAHCAFGSELQKYTEFLCCPLTYPIALAALGDKICRCKSKHFHRATGLDEHGESRAAKAAAYPWPACQVIAEILLTPLSPASSSRLHVGSCKPHAADGHHAEHERKERWAPLGSMRSMEPELKENLQVEPFPATNIPRRTDALDPPTLTSPMPGPFTTRQLIPIEAIETTLKFGRDVTTCMARARRGPQGWRVAKTLRPEVQVIEEDAALHPCGRGFIWQRVHPDEPFSMSSMWEAVRPSCYPSDPPHPPGTKDRIVIEEYLRLAKAHGFTDERVLSLIKHGFTSPEMPRATVLAPPHVGALKEAAAYAERNQRDAHHGFATKPAEFPKYWPTYLDPCNIVVQNGKPRLTIDKTMWTTKLLHLRPYNELVNIKKINELIGKLRLPSIAQFCRGGAILMSALLASDTIKVKQFKMDKQAFFRVHSKQRMHICLSGRATEAGFMHDLTTNFGESDAPINTCCESDGFILFCREELLRLDSAYAPRVQSLTIFLAKRRRQRESQGDPTDVMTKFVWDALFFLMCYVDDDGLESFDDPLYDDKGVPVIILITHNDGSIERKHQTRIELYADACVKIGTSIGHTFPFDKREGPCGDFILLGIVSSLTKERRMLPMVKATNYLILLRAVRHGRKMPNGVVASPHKAANSLLHRLFHASDVEPLGRAHLFYFRQCMRNVKMIKTSDERSEKCILITKPAARELEWWAHRLSTNDEHLGLPLASRYSFPGASSDCCLVRYSDASREPLKKASDSGGGAWAVIKKTFYYIHITWRQDEMEKHSINVLEAHVRDIFGDIMIDYAKGLGLPITHTIAYIDNSTAEMIAENGRTSTATLHELNHRRITRRTKSNVFETNERVASVDNDVADMISRGAVEEALRIPLEEDLIIQRLEVPPEIREVPCTKE